MAKEETKTPEPKEETKTPEPKEETKTPAKPTKLFRYRIRRGQRYYRNGRLYFGDNGDTVLIPDTEKISATMEPKPVEEVALGAAPADEFDLEAEAKKLASTTNKGDLLKKAAAMNLDPNGSALELAERIITKERELKKVGT